MHKELGSNFKEEDDEDYDKRHEKCLDYKISVDVVDFYGGMDVEDWILDVENFFEYMKNFQDK